MHDAELHMLMSRRHRKEENDAMTKQSRQQTEQQALQRCPTNIDSSKVKTTLETTTHKSLTALGCPARRSAEANSFNAVCPPKETSQRNTLLTAGKKHRQTNDRYATTTHQTSLENHTRPAVQARASPMLTSDHTSLTDSLPNYLYLSSQLVCVQ